jgi:hypothetical protein
MLFEGRRVRRWEKVRREGCVHAITRLALEAGQGVTGDQDRRRSSATAVDGPFSPSSRPVDLGSWMDRWMDGITTNGMLLPRSLPRSCC